MVSKYHYRFLYSCVEMMFNFGRKKEYFFASEFLMFVKFYNYRLFREKKSAVSIFRWFKKRLARYSSQVR